MADHSIPNLRFVYHDLVWWPNDASSGAAGERLHYFFWQVTALWSAWRAHRRHQFQVTHHVTFNTIEVPGFMALLGIPFIWGPVGGGQAPPSSLSVYFGRRWLTELLRVGRKHVARLNPWNRYVVRNAAAVLAANGDTQRLLTRMGARNLLHELETAVDLPELSSSPTGHPLDRAFTILWAGGLIRRKAPALAIDVLSELRSRGVDARLRLAGEGPLHESLTELVVSRGLSSSVDFVGRVPYETMSDFYASGDAFLFTSLQDTSGNVLLEAMAQGKAIVTLDHQGAGEIVSAESGLKVIPSTPTATIEGLASALQILAKDDARRQTLGDAARKRAATEYSWERKRELIEELYASAVASRIV